VSRPDHYNRPGLPELTYRIGTHPTFLRRMLSGLSSQKVPDGPNGHVRPLSALTTRASEDPAVAMLDAWATVADVLTFYQERIANEGYLPTATERRSVLELARSIGYELNPGVAAGTFLAFTVEDAPAVPGTPGAPETVAVPRGTAVQSIPEQDQFPQTFETMEDIRARAPWNDLRPQTTEAQDPTAGESRLYLEGVNAQLGPGDAVLIVRGEHRSVLTLKAVTVQPPESGESEGYTVIEWGLENSEAPSVVLDASTEVYAFRQRAALFGHNAPDWRAMPNQVRKRYLRSEEGTEDDEWPGLRISDIADAEDEDTIYLDAMYPQVLPGGWVALSVLGKPKVYRVKAASESSRTGFTLSSRTTRAELENPGGGVVVGLLAAFDDKVRETVAFVKSERLELAQRPLAGPIQGGEIVLDRLAADLEPGRPIVVSGKRARAMIAEPGRLLKSEDGTRQVQLQPGDLLQVMEPVVSGGGMEEVVQERWRLMDRDGFVGLLEAAAGDVVLKPAAGDDPTVSEVAFIDDREDAVTSDRNRTAITLRDPLKGSYDRVTVRINANVARATHGESVRDEVLGSGDGARANQRFVLKKPPLTHVSAPTASGAESTLELRVNGVLWQEAPSLFGLDARSQSYAVRTDDDGKTRVIFGDGETGARLPSGPENVTATYRSGIGPDGMVGADTLALLQRRPLGIRGVTNPLPATGAAAPEKLDDARTNAPSTVVTLDRIVSLRDYEDFARAFAGIGKARAAAFWSGEHRVVHITVAASNGDEILPTSELYADLVEAIDAVRDPGQLVKVSSYKRTTFSLLATILVDRRYVVEEVKTRVKRELLRAFGFEKRGFGQPVAASEVIEVIQAAEGVEAVDLDELVGDASDPAFHPPAILPARVASQVGEKTELLLIDPNGIDLREMAQ